jgi:hypothetical protein
MLGLSNLASSDSHNPLRNMGSINEGGGNLAAPGGTLVTQHPRGCDRVRGSGQA